jgi:peptide/nickel transport system ATP-binding protein
VSIALEKGQESRTEPPRAFLDVRNLQVQFSTDDGVVKAVNNLSFTVERGRTLGIVGESGSGKSVTSQAILGLHKGTKARLSGQVWLDGEELVSASEEHVRNLRGSKMSMIFQDPLSAMHPYFTVGAQLVEAYRVHNKTSKADARKRAVTMLDRVGIPNAAKRADDYPHQFSGGMRQRAMIAMALISDPALLIADEPTTALDVTVQAQIMELMMELQEEFQSAIVLITHDLGVVAEVADEVVVMYAGSAVETGACRTSSTARRCPTPGACSARCRVSTGPSGAPRPDPGAPPSLINVPSGCPFHPRCAYRPLVPGGRLLHGGAGAARGRGRAPGPLPHPAPGAPAVWSEDIQPKL